MTPIRNDDDQREAPTVAFLLKNSFESYKSMIDRYENLLKETNKLSALIENKLNNLATLDQMNIKVESINREIDDKLEDFDKAAETRISKANEELESSRRSLESVVNTLTFRLNLVIAVLVAIFTIGGIAFTYIKFILDAKIEKQTHTIIGTRGELNQPDGIPYWIDDNNRRRYIYLEKVPDRRLNENSNPGTVVSGN